MFDVLRHREFRLLWFGNSISTIGDHMLIVVVGLFVRRLTGSSTDIGLVLAAYSAPLVLFLLFGGIVADRLPRQRVMIVSDLVRAALHATAALLIFSGVIRVWQLVVIGLGFGIADAFFRPAYTGLVPQTVPEDRIQAASGVSGLSRQLAVFVGPAVGTALVLGVGAAAAFALDALTFVVSALFLARLRPRPRGNAAHAATSNLLTELREGWQAVRERVWVWATIAAFSTAVFVGLAPFFVLGPAVAAQHYGTDAVYGYVNATWGIGTVAGVLVAGRVRPRRPMLVGLLGALVWPAAFSVFAVGPPVPVLLAFMLVAGSGAGVFGVLWETALAERVPPHLLSRVSAYDWMGSLALLPLGYVIAGPIGDAVGPVRVTFIGGLIGTVAILAALLPRGTRRLGLDDEPRALTQPPDAEAAHGVTVSESP